MKELRNIKSKGGKGVCFPIIRHHIYVVDIMNYKKQTRALALG